MRQTSFMAGGTRLALANDVAPGPTWHATHFTASAGFVYVVLGFPVM